MKQYSGKTWSEIARAALACAFAVLLLAMIGVADQAVAASYDVNGVSTDMPSVATSGNRVTVSWTVRTNRPVNFRYLQLANKNQPGSGFNPNTMIDGARTFTTVQTMPDGEHSTTIVYSLDGIKWIGAQTIKYKVGASVQYDANGVALEKPVVQVNGNQVSFGWTVRTNRPINFRYLQLYTPGQAGAGFNTWVTLNGARTFSATQSLPNGTFNTLPVYSIDGNAWVGGPPVAYTVGADGQPPSDSKAPLALPAKMVGGYWMKWAASQAPRFAEVDQKYNTIYLAFAEGQWGSGKLTFAQNRQSREQFKADVDAARARGQRVILSIGGEGVVVDLSSDQRCQQAVDSLAWIRDNEAVFDGIDWDIEMPSLHSDGMYCVSRKLKAKYGNNFAITMAPAGNRDDYKALAKRLGADLDFIGIQYYDYYEPSQQSRIDGVKWRSQQLIADYGIASSKIGIGFRVTDGNNRYVPDGVGSNWWSINGAKDAVRQLETLYPNMRGGYLWEVRADWINGNRWVNEVGAEIKN